MLVASKGPNKCGKAALPELEAAIEIVEGAEEQPTSQALENDLGKMGKARPTSEMKNSRHLLARSTGGCFPRYNWGEPFIGILQAKLNEDFMKI